MNLEETIQKRWETLGFESLFSEEQDYIRLWWLIAELNNGGFDQYFHNDTANDALQTLAALERVGARRTHELLSEALAFFGSDYPTERDARSNVLCSRASFESLERRLTDAFNDDTEPLLEPALHRIQLLYEERQIPIA